MYTHSTDLELATFVLYSRVYVYIRPTNTQMEYL